MTDWVRIFDDADAPPDLALAYAAGFRRAARYGGAQSWKSITAAERDRLFAAGYGIQPMYEATADRALSGGYAGGQSDAKAARAFWRNLGLPDDVPIAAAVDTNVGTGDHAALKAYFQGWNSVDTCKPIAYIEDDIGEVLYNDGLILGIFTPAAYGWNNPAVLYTPSNAPAHVLWTQEHNGVTKYGGNIDIGHIRMTTPCWEADMAAIDVWNSTEVDVITPDPAVTDGTNLSWRPKGAMEWVINHIHTLILAVADLQTKVAALPTTAAPAAPLSDADVARIAAAVLDEQHRRDAS